MRQQQELKHVLSVREESETDPPRITIYMRVGTEKEIYVYSIDITREYSINLSLLHLLPLGASLPFNFVISDGR